MALLFDLLVLIVVINSVMLNAHTVLLKKVSVLNLLVLILTSVSSPIALTIHSVFSIQTPVLAWIPLVSKLLMAVVITSRISSTLAVEFGVVHLVIVMQNSSPTQEKVCS